MKRTTFIIIGAVVVLILVCVWLYLLFFATPGENGVTFGNFGFGDTTDTTYDDTTEGDVADVIVDTASTEKLRQLTTVPVLAYREVQHTASSTPEIYYVEAGTGHIYSINYETGQTKRLSATTIPVATKAALSPNGQFVMYRSGDGNGAEYVVGSLSTSSEKINTTALSENIVDFIIPNNSEILYGVQLQSSYVGKRYSLTTGQTSTLFTIPFREVAVSWGDSSDATHYVYPKATDQLQGFVYKVKGGVLTRLPIDGYGLSAIGTSDTILYSDVITTYTNREYISSIYTFNEETKNQLPFSVIPEKCVATAIPIYYCAAPLDLKLTQSLPDAWYQGKVNLSDTLWEIDSNQGRATMLVDIQAKIGRQIDVTNIIHNDTQTRLYFTDRHNKLLWVYELIQG